MYNYIPAREVPARLAKLIESINRLTANSSLREFAEIYREFIVIHPFGDGNGRTARVLLDYILLKNGHGPVTHDFGLTRDTLYQSIDELAGNLFGRRG